MRIQNGDKPASIGFDGKGTSNSIFLGRVHSLQSPSLFCDSRKLSAPWQQEGWQRQEPSLDCVWRPRPVQITTRVGGTCTFA
jgi:hypothetical protein